MSIFVTFSLLLSACSAFAPATPNPQDQQATVEAAVAQTLQAVSAALTSTAAAMPTATFTMEPTATTAPTNTPEPLPTATVYIPPTATRVIIPATAVPTNTATPAIYACKLLSTSPAAGTKINTNTDFDAKWEVQNVGTHIWDLGYVDLKYISGTKMQTKADIFDVKTALESGQKLTLIVDMKTPSTAGKYSAVWYLTMDGTPMCTLPVDIEAVNP